MKKIINKLTGLTLLAYIVLVVAVFAWGLFGDKDNSENKSTDTTTSPTPTTTTPKQTTTYTTAQVGTHSTKSSCWTIYAGKVYDITNYFGSHPAGNSTLLEMCGVNSDSIYDSMHIHSSAATAMLKSYYIGDLAN